MGLVPTDSARHDVLLSQLLDPISIARTLTLFVDRGGMAARRCLVLGAGANASLGVWLAKQVGVLGSVLATDVSCPLPAVRPANLDLLEHDLTSGEPIPGGDRDFIHARLDLARLPKRGEILAQLVGALAADGILLLEDWEPFLTGDVMPDAYGSRAADLYGRYQQAVGELAFSAADRSWSPLHLQDMLQDSGLTGVNTAIEALVWSSGDVGCQLCACVLNELRPQLLTAGMTNEELEQLQALLLNTPGFALKRRLYSTSGRRRR